MLRDGAAGSHYLAAVAVLLDRDDVLIAEHRFRAGAWALPGGWVHRLESPYRAVERELAEELGVDARAVTVVGCEQQGFPGHLRPSSLTIAFACRRPFREIAPFRLDSGELAAAAWINTSEAAAVLSPFEYEAVVSAQRYELADSPGVDSGAADDL